jgi:hypothetical protein
MRQTRYLLYPLGYRGFESLSLRHPSTTYGSTNCCFTFRFVPYLCRSTISKANPLGMDREVLGRQVRVALHHLERFPAPKLLQHEKRRARATSRRR